MFEILTSRKGLFLKNMVDSWKDSMASGRFTNDIFPDAHMGQRWAL